MILMRTISAVVFATLIGGAGAAAADDAENLFWQSILNSTDGTEYCAYLESYPKGAFALLAKLRAKKFGGDCATGGASAKAPQGTSEPKKSKTGDAAAKDFFTSDNYYAGKRAFDAGDYKKAVEFWIVPAEQGVPEAQAMIGNMYHGGFGLEKDYAQALSWYMKAAKQGVAQAQLGIGSLYGDGKGVEKDYVLARMWFSISAYGGNERAEYNLNKVAQRMTEAEISKAEKMALDWLKKHNLK